VSALGRFAHGFARSSSDRQYFSCGPLGDRPSSSPVAAARDVLHTAPSSLHQGRRRWPVSSSLSRSRCGCRTYLGECQMLWDAWWCFESHRRWRGSEYGKARAENRPSLLARDDRRLISLRPVTGPADAPPRRLTRQELVSAITHRSHLPHPSQPGGTLQNEDNNGTGPHLNAPEPKSSPRPTVGTDATIRRQENATAAITSTRTSPPSSPTPSDDHCAPLNPNPLTECPPDGRGETTRRGQIPPAHPSPRPPASTLWVILPITPRNP
jgi:hypothetical protein